MIKRIVRTEGNFDPDEWSNDPQNVLRCLDPGKTVQSQRDEADINVIVRNFGLTGKVPESVRMPSYGDFTGVVDYRSAVEAIDSAERSFMQMPAEFRAKFDNDPQGFLDYVMTPGHEDELRKFGLMIPEVLPPVEAKPTGS